VSNQSLFRFLAHSVAMLLPFDCGERSQLTYKGMRRERG